MKDDSIETDVLKMGLANFTGSNVMKDDMSGFTFVGGAKCTVERVKTIYNCCSVFGINYENYAKSNMVLNDLEMMITKWEWELQI